MFEVAYVFILLHKCKGKSVNITLQVGSNLFTQLCVCVFTQAMTVSVTVAPVVLPWVTVHTEVDLAQAITMATVQATVVLVTAQAVALVTRPTVTAEDQAPTTPLHPVTRGAVAGRATASSGGDEGITEITENMPTGCIYWLVALKCLKIYFEIYDLNISV